MTTRHHTVLTLLFCLVGWDANEIFVNKLQEKKKVATVRGKNEQR